MSATSGSGNRTVRLFMEKVYYISGRRARHDGSRAGARGLGKPRPYKAIESGLSVQQTRGVPTHRGKARRDFSLHRPTHSQERMRKKKSAFSVRNDGARGAHGNSRRSRSLAAAGRRGGTACRAPTRREKMPG
jgi:hypothetical protein